MKRKEEARIERKIFILFEDYSEKPIPIDDGKGGVFGYTSKKQKFDYFVYDYFKRELNKSGVNAEIVHEVDAYYAGILGKKLPRGYDCYILHLSQVSEEQIIELREEQPWSWIYAMTLGNVPNSLRPIIDGDVYIGLSLDEVVNKISKPKREARKI